MILPVGEVRSVTLPEPLRAAIYTRVSTALQEQEGSSLDTQLASCRQYAEQRGYVVDDRHIYREVHTGVELWERPQLQRMREAVRRHEADVVIVHAIDRLAREPVHLGVIISEADHAGATVEFVTEILDDSPEGQLIRFVRGYAAKIEHEKIKERVMRGIRHRVAQGRMLAGRKAPYGYRWLPDVLDSTGKSLIVKPGLEEDAATARIVHRIFENVAAGTTLRALAMALTADRIPTPTGRPNWQHTTLRAILLNPVYVGRPMAFRGVQETIKTAAGRRKVMRVRPEAEQVALPEGTAPALVDEATFQAGQQRLRLNREQSARNNRAPEETLLRAGFIHCGYCGAAMIVRRGKIVRYRCGRSLQPNDNCFTGGISATIIDDAVWLKVSAILRRPEIVAEELARMRQNDPTGADLAAIDRELLKIERQQANLIEQLAELGGAVGGMVRAKLASLQSEHERLQADRSATLSVRSAWQRAQEQLGGLERWCHQVAAKLDSLTYEDRRLALEALAVRVRVWRPEHEPRYEIRATPGLDAPIVDNTAGSSSSPPAARSRRRRRRRSARR